jgi:hypothetical protein
MCELLCDRWPIEVIALTLTAAMELKKCQLLCCFHTLSDDPMLETATHANDRASDDGVF